MSCSDISMKISTRSGNTFLWKAVGTDIRKRAPRNVGPLLLSYQVGYLGITWILLAFWQSCINLDLYHEIFQRQWASFPARMAEMMCAPTGKVEQTSCKICARLQPTSGTRWGPSTFSRLDGGAWELSRTGSSNHGIHTKTNGSVYVWPFDCLLHRHYKYKWFLILRG